MKISRASLTTHLECNSVIKSMRRLFRKGERVRSKIDGKVMEVLKYLKQNIVEVKMFDPQSKEVRTDKVKEDKLSKAA